MPIITKKKIIEYMQTQNEKCGEALRKLIEKEKEHDQFLEDINSLLKKEKLVIVDACKDKYGKDSFVLLQDERKVSPILEGKDFKYEGHYLKGSIVLLVISEGMHIRPCLRYTDYPYLEASCIEQGKLHIDNLFTQSSSLPYGGRGYGRMLIEAAERVCKISDYTLLHGGLSYVDAKTEETKEHRNGFYEHLGFQMAYDEKRENGGFRKEV